MRIALCGSHSTGKTTILDLLEGNKIKEQARTLISELGNPRDMNDSEKANFQQILLTRQIRAEIMAGDDFISDRSIYDIIAYSIDLQNIDSLTEQANNYLAKNPYDLTFYFPIEFDMENDGVRPEDEEFRKTIDKRIFALLPNPIFISGTIEQRKKKIEQEISKYIKEKALKTTK